MLGGRPETALVSLSTHPCARVRLPKRSRARIERAVAASWSLAGWPYCANCYRRNAAKAMRILKRVREAAR